MLSTAYKTLLAPGKLSSRLAHGAFWSFLGEAGARGLTFLGSLVVARVLGLADFGAYALLNGTLAMVAIFAAFGLGETTSRFAAMLRDSDPARLARLNTLSLAVSLVSGVLGSIALWCFAPLIAEGALARPDLTGALRLAAPILAFGAITGGFSGTVRGFEAFNRLARVSLTSAALQLTLVAIGSYTMGLDGAVLGLLVSEATQTLMMGMLARRVSVANGVPFLVGGSFRERTILWSFSLPAFFSGVMHVPMFWFSQMIIASYGGVAQLGLYNAAQRWMTLVSFAPLAASGIIGPVLSNLSSSNDHGTHRKTTLTLALLQVCFCVPVAALVALLGRPAMALFGHEFAAGGAVVAWVVALAPLIVVLRLFWDALLSVGHAWTAFAVWSLWAAAAVGLTWLWRHDGAVGLAQAMLVAYALAAAAHLAALLLIWRRLV